jgi:cytidylate kinase
MTVVAIDGPAGAGKSTVARALADALGYTLLDTGAMYRIVALAAQRSGLAPADAARTAGIDVRGGARLDGEDVSALIRTPGVSEAASAVAADPAVREAVVAQQQRLLADGDWVAEGRDIGTVVAPTAEVKVFLTADPTERARRRAAELDASVEDVLADLARRDERDQTREHSPLVKAEDAVEIDSTGLSLDEVVARVVARVRALPRG